MITTGIIKEIAVNKGNFVGNAYRVELNIFQTPGDDNKNNYTYIANCSTMSGFYDSYEVGDKVFVGFLNNNKSLPVIIGKIYQGLKDESRSFANINSLKVRDRAELPKNTNIGGIDFSDKAYFFDNVNEIIRDKDLFVNSIQFKTGSDGAGLVYFDDFEGVLQSTLSPEVTMAFGVDTVLKIYNDTANDLVDGQVVYNSGNVSDTTAVKLAIANDHPIANNTIGVITEHILSHERGFISRRGYVGGLLIYLDDDDPDPANHTHFELNDALYLSPNNPGKFTRVKPSAPNFVTYIGYVNKLSSDDSTYDGQIYVDIRIIPISSDISYNNEIIIEEEKRLSSRNVQGAIDELQLDKADISMLSSNITLYHTLVDSDIPTYKKLVTSTTDPDFPVVATEVSSGAITGADQYIASAVSDAGIFVGNPGQINIFSISRVKKTYGNNNQNAEFFFRMYRREVDGTEHLVATSATTGVVSSTDWLVFNATALLNNGDFAETDRIVVKSYANVVGIPGGIFSYEFGGDTNPFRVLIPVPVSVIPNAEASAIITDISNFNTILSSDDTNVQAALDTLDNHTHPATAISLVPLDNIQATSVQEALYELDNEKLQKSQHDGAWIDSEGALNYYGQYG